MQLIYLIEASEYGTSKDYLYARDPYKAKYQLLINKRVSTGLKYLIDSNAFIEYLNDMHDIYEYIEEYNPKMKY